MKIEDIEFLLQKIIDFGIPVNWSEDRASDLLEVFDMRIFNKFGYLSSKKIDNSIYVAFEDKRVVVFTYDIDSFIITPFPNDDEYLYEDMISLIVMFLDLLAEEGIVLSIFDDSENVKRYLDSSENVLVDGHMLNKVLVDDLSKGLYSYNKKYYL